MISGATISNGREPVRRISRELICVPAISAMPDGRKASPALSASYPSRFCRYSVMKNQTAKIAEDTSSAARLAARGDRPRIGRGRHD